MRIFEIQGGNAVPVSIRSLEDPEKVYELLRMSCEPWYQATKGFDDLAFRGLSYGGLKNCVFMQSVRADRKPKDTGDQLQDVFNAMLKAAGAQANRSNSIFVSSDPNFAGEFGTAYVAFPAGQFSYTWLLPYQDATHLAMHEIIKCLKDPAMEKIHNRGAIHTLHSSTNDFELMQNADNYDPTKVKSIWAVNKNLHNALTLGHELMISCETVMYVPVDFYFDSVIKWVRHYK